ncbi:MAG: histone deacetylase family protein, partial [Bacteroidota bacterium]
KFNTSYSKEGAAAPGRMEAIMTPIRKETVWQVVAPAYAAESDLELAHPHAYIESIRERGDLFDLARLSAGGAIAASSAAYYGEPSFAAIRPPGHHAYKEMSWGYCYFSNMAIALLRLRRERKIKSAFVLDFDAHTGDGTRDVLREWKECKILNPMAENNKDYLKLIEDYIRSDAGQPDIIGVCAGFDSYVKDVGRKLETFDFYQIGNMIKNFAKKLGHNRRFAVLEGGYYLPDLGKNVISFCQGME